MHLRQRQPRQCKLGIIAGNRGEITGADDSDQPHLQHNIILNGRAAELYSQLNTLNLLPTRFGWFIEKRKRAWLMEKFDHLCYYFESSCTFFSYRVPSTK
jgi:hypothetical protein